MEVRVRNNKQTNMNRNETNTATNNIKRNMNQTNMNNKLKQKKNLRITQQNFPRSNSIQ